MKLTCMLTGHKWEKDYRNVNAPLYGAAHICSRCGITQNHSWERIENRCRERCAKCGLEQSIKHNWVEKMPCRFVCEICGEQEERHSLAKKSDCEKVCSKCGKAEVTHKWNMVRKDFPGETFWSMAQTRIFADSLPQNSMGCTCERCGETNPTGVHVCSGAWEGDWFVTRCKRCGTICKKETSKEIEARRYERAVNEDEGIFR